MNTYIQTQSDRTMYGTTILRYYGHNGVWKMKKICGDTYGGKDIYIDGLWITLYALEFNIRFIIYYN